MSAADRVFFDTNVLEKWQTNFWDALILAAAERARCVTVWSDDLSSGQTYGAVRVLPIAVFRFILAPPLRPRPATRRPPSARAPPR